MPESLHIDIPNAQIHPPKDFTTASKNAQILKSEKGSLSWEQRTSLPPVNQFIDATSGAAAEVDQDAYILVGTPSSDWDGALENDFVRYDSSLDTWFAITPTEGMRVYDKLYDGFWTYVSDLGVSKWTGTFQKSVTINSTQAKALFTTPIQIVAAPVGKSITLIDWTIETDFTTPAYSAEDTLWLKTETATIPQGVDTTSLLSSVSRIKKGELYSGSWLATDTQIIEAKKLELTTDSADPTLGNSSYIVTANFWL